MAKCQHILIADVPDRFIRANRIDEMNMRTLASLPDERHQNYGIALFQPDYNHQISISSLTNMRRTIR